MRVLVLYAHPDPDSFGAALHRKAVESLRQAEWRFRTLFRAAPDVVLTVLQSGRVREANDAVRDVVGKDPVATPPDASGRGWRKRPGRGSRPRRATLSPARTPSPPAVRRP